MNTTNGTAPAPESATPTSDDVELVHYFWVRDPLSRNICGTPSDGSRPNRPRIVHNVGGLMAITKRQDCPTCVDLYERYLAGRRASGATP